MAKRRDQLIAMAQDREAGAKIATLKSVKEFNVSIGDILRLREKTTDGKEGRVYKEVHLLNCFCRVAGVAEPIMAEIQMESGDNWGVGGELEQCILPALAQFVQRAIKAHIGAVNEKQKPLPESPPPFANPDGTMAKPPNPGRVDFNQRMRAAKEAKRLAEEQGQAATGQPATTAAPAETENAEVTNG